MAVGLDDLLPWLRTAVDSLIDVDAPSIRAVVLLRCRRERWKLSIAALDRVVHRLQEGQRPMEISAHVEERIVKGVNPR